LAEDDRANYTEYVPGPDCEHPRLDRTGFGSTLEMCLSMYKANDFTEISSCEKESLFKQKTAPHLLQDYDLKWLVSTENRKRACMDLLARKGKLGVLDSVSRWLNGRWEKSFRSLPTFPFGGA
jgi:hypothetical protein